MFEASYPALRKGLPRRIPRVERVTMLGFTFEPIVLLRHPEVFPVDLDRGRRSSPGGDTVRKAAPLQRLQEGVGRTG
jgi:hypothetical protein